MLNDITIGQFFPGNSFIHKLDPRTKIALCVAYIIILFFLVSSIVYTFNFIVVFAILLIAKIPLKMIIKSIKPLYFIIVITFVFQIFSTNGKNIIKWHFLTITKEGVFSGITLSSRLILLILMSSLLTYTTSPLDFTDAIEKLLNPLKKIKVPAHEIAMIMTIALRFIPTLIEELDRIIKAQQSRGANFTQGSLIRRMQHIIPILVPLFISAFRRADELAIAMEARCYRGGHGRTKMKKLFFTWRDGIAVLYFIFIIIVITSIYHYSYTKNLF